ncbi:MAG: putative ATPase, partial [Cyclobacteriaceae bacterium]
MSLFDQQPVYQPLAAKMRPRNLDEFVGQQHLLGPGKPL